MRYDPTIYKELQKIRDRIPRNTYKTICLPRSPIISP